MSFLTEKVISEGLTFDDVLLIPAYSEILPREVELKSKFTRNIVINTPVVSAAMDTVTEYKLAIAIAREGGIGVIHKNMDIDEQARQVISVKRAENGMIFDPVTIMRGKKVADALELMSTFKIGGIPVVDAEGYLVGIVTNRDLRFEKNMDRPIEEVMTSENLITTTESTNLEKASEILQNHKIEKLPVVDRNGKLIGLVTYKDITKAKDKPLACKDEKGRLRVAAAVGISGDSMDRIDELVKAQVDALVIDTAHGHTKGVLDMLTRARKKYPDTEIVAGNIATAEAAIALVKAGA
ncbi:MAG TPA: IMP dehydrogenase, partial [Prolixibacteraceae bacterium]|nr:IMP dehydrogenase [Prolixibacteraceae bacterium]